MQDPLPLPLTQLFQKVMALLSQDSKEQSQLEAEQITLWSLRQGPFKKKFERLDLYLNSSELVSGVFTSLALNVARQRAQGVPLQYLICEQVFLGHNFNLVPGVFIPRPETELLCLEAIQFLQPLGDRLTSAFVGLEVGVGSGVISVSLLAHFPALFMQATDVNPLARELSLKNFENIVAPKTAWDWSRLQVFAPSTQAEVLTATLQDHPTQFDFLISNPPYLLGREEMQPQVWEYEPHEALLSPAGKALYFYEEIAREASGLLKPGGFVFLELPHERAHAIVELFCSFGFLTQVKLDLSARERVLIAKKIRIIN